LKLVVTSEIKLGLIEYINIVNPIYYDYWIGPLLVENIKLTAC